MLKQNRFFEETCIISTGLQWNKMQVKTMFHYNLLKILVL